MKIIIAITGASGVILGKRLTEELHNHELHLIISSGARDVAAHENVDFNQLMGKVVRLHGEHDMGSILASSSNPMDAMVVVPCSMKSLSALANGYTDNLISRSAENILKLGGRLIVCPRDTPLTLAAIDNMRSLKLAGAIILPPNMAYYNEPKGLDDVTNFFVGKIMDALGIDHGLYHRWGGKQP
jgi:4-hydroxy-3-polyprenylbenzoate decarboxylase